MALPLVIGAGAFAIGYWMSPSPCAAPECKKQGLPYKHEPLKEASKTIRVLRLKAGKQEEELYGTLIVREVQDVQGRYMPFTSKKPSYQAISYRWEDVAKHTDPRTVKHIHIDGRALPISDSLHECLQHLRLEDVDKYLWVDQICIDQEKRKDNTDTLFQIPMMGAVYSGAESTYIWLGDEPSEEEKEAMKLIRRFTDFRKHLERIAQGEARLNMATVARRGKQHDMEFKTEAQWQFNMMWMHAMKDEGSLLNMGVTSVKSLPILDRKSALAFCALFRREWFLRTWCAQEVVRSGPKIVVLGDHRLDWNDMAFAAGYLHHKHKLDDFNVPERDMQGLKAAYWAFSYQRVYDDGYSFVEMLRMTRLREATNLADKVYGLYGMVDFAKDSKGATRFEARRQGLGNKHVPNVLLPIKNVNVTWLYVDVAKYIIEKEKTLEILAAKGWNDASGLVRPTWMPWWHLEEEYAPIWLTMPYSGREWYFSACTARDPEVRCETLKITDKKQLMMHDDDRQSICRVHGIQAAKVTQVVAKFKWKSPTDMWSQIACMIAKACAVTVSAHRMYTIETLALLLTAGRRSFMVLNPNEDREGMREHVKDFFALARMLCAEYRGKFTREQRNCYESMLRDVQMPQYEYSDVIRQIDPKIDYKKSAYAEWCMEALRNRVVVTTSYRHPFGLTTGSVQVDDVVVVLKGGLVPFVLHSAEKNLSDSSTVTHNLVGDFYGGGDLMHGALDQAARESKKEYVLG